MAKAKKLTWLTVEENKVWEKTFAFYVTDEGMSDAKADRATWKDMQNQFPRLRAFSGCKADDTYEKELRAEERRGYPRGFK